MELNFRAHAGLFSSSYLSGCSTLTVVDLLDFFAQSVGIMIASPQAARLRILFPGKLVVLHLHEGPD